MQHPFERFDLNFSSISEAAHDFPGRSPQRLLRASEEVSYHFFYHLIIIIFIFRLVDFKETF